MMETIEYQTKTTYTLDEFRRFSYEVQYKLNHAGKIQMAMFTAFCLMALGSLAGEGRSLTAACLVCAVLVAPVFQLVLNQAVKKSYAANKAVQESESVFSFYSDHLEQDNALGHLTLEYSKIYRILETGTNFYIMVSKNQGFIIIKENCSPELIGFLQKLKNKGGN